MSVLKEDTNKLMELFEKNWALVTAGSIEDYNSCTVSWGSLGNIGGNPGQSHKVATVYIHPARYTSEFLKRNDFFTVSFFDPKFRKALGYMGSHSGRDGDKAKGAGLTPVAFGDGVTFEEAELTLLCRKLYLHQFTKEDLSQDVQDYYASLPQTYPDFKGGWQPHYQIIGSVTDIK